MGVPVGKHLTENALLTELVGHEQGSIIVIIATDARCCQCNSSDWPSAVLSALGAPEPVADITPAISC